MSVWNVHVASCVIKNLHKKKCERKRMEGYERARKKESYTPFRVIAETKSSSLVMLLDAKSAHTCRFITKNRAGKKYNRFKELSETKVQKN